METDFFFLKTGSPCVTEAGLELAAAFLPLPPEYWDHRYMSPYIYWFKNNHTRCIREYAWLEHYAVSTQSIVLEA